MFFLYISTYPRSPKKQILVKQSNLKKMIIF